MGSPRKTRIFQYLYWFVNIWLWVNFVERVVYFVKDLFERVECLAGGGIPKDVQNYIKMGILKAVFEQLTESYSKVKKVEKLLENF